MPKILDKAVEKIKAAGSAVNPWAAAVASQQKAGNLKQGTLEPTKQGVARGQMTSAQREAKPPNPGSKAPPSARDHAEGLVKSYRAKD
jgi:hypothetical protein